MAAPPPILILPFGLLLGAMALGPVLAPRWWLAHYPKVALGLGAITAGVYLFILHDSASLGHALHEYISFIALVGSLFVVAGGIQLRAPGDATPLANVVFLFAGAVAANVLGTTGAAMLLIRPWLHMNRRRIAAYHVAFFIFLVANVGGCLTPIGDPPLFLGFLQGIPFWWVAQKCWSLWAVGTGLLLAIFFVMDRISFVRAQGKGGTGDPPVPSGNLLGGTGKTPRSGVSGFSTAALSAVPVGGSPTGAGESPAPPRLQAWQFEGLPNLLFLAIVLVAVFIEQPLFLREGLMLAAAAGSYFTTKKAVHDANEFNFHPAAEVAVLFAGVFMTMTPALAWLEHGAGQWLGPNPAPEIFYWGAGGLSAVLDNAPTYLGFLNALFGVAGTDETAQLLDQKPVHVLAISIGAVFFGAATYIGNGPNFMVKAIAAQHGVSMPSFLRFVLKFSLPILLPVLIIVWLLFFRD